MRLIEIDAYIRTVRTRLKAFGPTARKSAQKELEVALKVRESVADAVAGMAKALSIGK